MVKVELVSAKGEPEKLVDPKIAQWIDSADAIMGQLLPLHGVLKDVDCLSDGAKRVVGAISTACAVSTGSQLILVEHGRLGDAEIIWRSVLEGTLKFAYILTEPQSAEERCQEYSGPLFDFALVKDHYHAHAIVHDARLEIVGIDSIKTLMLQPEELTRVTSAYSKSARKAIEAKWSVTSIVKSLAESGRPEDKPFVTLFRPYTLASHIAHVDYYGIAAMRERERRDADEKQALNLAHAARLVTDGLEVMIYRLFLMRQAGKLDSTDLIQPYESLKAFHRDLDDAHRFFDDFVTPPQRDDQPTREVDG